MITRLTPEQESAMIASFYNNLLGNSRAVRGMYSSNEIRRDYILVDMPTHECRGKLRAEFTIKEGEEVDNYILRLIGGEFEETPVTPRTQKLKEAFLKLIGRSEEEEFHSGSAPRAIKDLGEKLIAELKKSAVSQQTL